MKSYLISFFCLILLSGCDASSFLEIVYFNRVKFSFTSEDNLSKYIYLCKKGETEEKTKQRAELANKHFVTNLGVITESFAKSFFPEIEPDAQEGSSNKGSLEKHSLKKRGTEDKNSPVGDSFEGSNSEKKSQEENSEDAIKAATIKLEEDSEKLALELEEKFQCLLIEFVELE